MKTIVDYMALLETSLSTAEAAAILNVDVSRIRQRIRERTLFGIEYEGEWRLPRFQFERKRCCPGLQKCFLRCRQRSIPSTLRRGSCGKMSDLDIW